MEKTNTRRWIERIRAADPGKMRLQKASKTTISLILSLLTTLSVLTLTGQETFAAIISAMAGMMGIIMIMDETEKDKKITTILLGFSGIAGITLGSSFSDHTFIIEAIMVTTMFLSFYLTKFSVRYFSLSMFMFMTVYISSVLQPATGQLPWFYLAIVIGISYAFLFNFILFQNTAKTLLNGITSFHIQSNITFELILEAIDDKQISENRIKRIDYHLKKTRTYALAVSSNSNKEDVQKLWPGLTPAQLKLYVFDTSMLNETLADAIQKLKQEKALENNELKRILRWVIISIRNTEVLGKDYKEQQLEEAETAVQAIRLLVDDLFYRYDKPYGWFFLVRRIESIANHVINGAITIQEALNGEASKEEEADEEDNGKDEEETKGIKQSTKKAIQVVIAGIIAIIVGKIISPAQPYWVVLTTFVMLLGTNSIGRIYTKSVQRSVGTVIGAVFGFLLAQLLTGKSLIGVVFIFIILFFAYYLMNVSYMAMSVFITMMIAFMYDILMGGITFELMFARVVDTIVGALIAFGVSLVIFPKRTSNKVTESITDYFSDLKPYMEDYLRGFREESNVRDLSGAAFELDQKLQTIKDEAAPITQRTMISPENASMNKLITMIGTINYYARQLIASKYKKEFEYPTEMKEVFERIDHKLIANIDSVMDKLTGERSEVDFHDLQEEREQIERHAPITGQAKQDLIHHLYYIWRINHVLKNIWDKF